MSFLVTALIWESGVLTRVELMIDPLTFGQQLLCKSVAMSFLYPLPEASVIALVMFHSSQISVVFSLITE